MTAPRPNLLLVAASDSSGGSGLQADLRVCAAFGVHPLTVLTAVTAQGATALRRLEPVGVGMIGDQLAAIEDLPIAAVKIGALPEAAAIRLLAEWLARRRLHVVLDPVLETSGGQALADDAARAAMLRWLVPAATVVTPNLPELRRLAGGTAEGADPSIAAARRLGPGAVLVKGGHGVGEVCEDLLVLADRVESFRHRRRAGRGARGTGCALAAAIAAGLARGDSLDGAVRRGIDYVQDALKRASPLGGGATVI